MTAPMPKEWEDSTIELPDRRLALRPLMSSVRDNAYARGVADGVKQEIDSRHRLIESLDGGRAALMREAAPWIRNEVDGMEHIKCYEKSQEAWCKNADALIARLEERAK